MIRILRKSTFKTAVGLSLGLVTLTLSACQTAPVDANRSPAQIDEKRFALLQSDVAEMMGLYARSVFLGKTLAQLDVRKRLFSGRNYELHPDSINTSFDFGAYVVGGTSLGIVIRSFFEADGAFSSNRNLEKYLGKFVFEGLTPEGSAKSILIGSVFAASFSGAVAYSADPKDVAENGMPANFSLLMTFRRDDMDQYYQSLADLDNAKVRAKFVAELKAASADISARVGPLFQMNGIETKVFSHRLQSKMIEAFEGKKNWRTDQKFQVDINGLVRQVLPDGEERIKALTYVLAEVRKNSTHGVDLDSPKAIRAWLESSIASLKKLEGGALQIYDQIEDSSDKDRHAMTPKYVALAGDIDALMKKLAVHAKLF